MMLRKVWFSDLEIVEICGQINSEEYQQSPLTEIEIVNTEKQEPFNRSEKQNSINRNATKPYSTKQNQRKKTV